MLELLIKRRYLYKWTHPVVGEIRTLHRVTSNVSKHFDLRPYEVGPEVLERLILDYKRKGYKFISIDEMVALLHRKYHFPFARQKNVVFTLDDGYADNFINAYPIFKKYNIPFCIYVCKKYITGEEQAGAGENYEMLSVPQLKALVADPLCTIGCHTLSHPQLSKLPYQEQEREIMEAKQWLETTLGTAIHHFAYPYGDYNTDTISIVRSAGFKSAVSVRKLKTRGNEGELYLYQIPRITIHPKE